MTNEIYKLVSSLKHNNINAHFQLQILELRLKSNLEYHKNTNSEERKLQCEEVLQDVADAISYICTNKTLDGFLVDERMTL